MTKWSEITPDTKVNLALVVSLLIGGLWLADRTRDRTGLVTVDVFTAKMETLTVKVDSLAAQQDARQAGISEQLRDIKERLTALERPK